MNGIDLLIVDDSATVRKVLVEILKNQTQIANISVASDPNFAFKKIKAHRPDVIISDIEMPNMDGLTFLKQIMETDPIPVIICSSVAESNSSNAILALELGAIEIITKPRLGTQSFLEESQATIMNAILAAYTARNKLRVNLNINKGIKSTSLKNNLNNSSAPKITENSKQIIPGFHTEKANDADVMVQKIERKIKIQTTEKIILIGSSTGGTEALKYILAQMPADAPGIIITQHMPENFTKSFANSLNNICKMNVKEAENGDLILKGQVIISKGGFHSLLKRKGMHYYVEVKDGPKVSRHKPSVDVLFRSASNYVGENAVAAILTGMGNDGAAGMLDLKKAGAKTIAQDEESCVVYGMPKEAVKNGSINLIVSLQNMATTILAQADYRGYR